MSKQYCWYILLVGSVLVGGGACTHSSGGKRPTAQEWQNRTYFKVTTDPHGLCAWMDLPARYAPALQGYVYEGTLQIAVKDQQRYRWLDVIEHRVAPKAILPNSDLFCLSADYFPSNRRYRLTYHLRSSGLFGAQGTNAPGKATLLIHFTVKNGVIKRESYQVMAPTRSRALLANR